MGVVSADPQLTVEFDTPAQYVQAATQSNLTWVLIVFDEGSQASIDVGANSVEAAWNHSSIRTKSTVLGLSQSFNQPEQSNPVDWSGSLQTNLAFANRWSSLWIQGDGLNVQLRDVGGRMLQGQSREVLSESNGIPPGASRSHLVTGPVFESFPASHQVQFTISGNVTRLEWHNATTSCSTQTCPDGASSTPTKAGPLMVGQSYFADWYLTGRINGTGYATTIVSGGPASDMLLQGNVRLPRATGHLSCEKCNLDANGTLSLEGQANLIGIRETPEGRLTAGVSGSARARVDETWLDADLTWQVPVAAGALVATGIVLWKLVLVGLFSRLVDPLENPTRRKIMECIQDTPGVTFREVQRVLALGNGTVWHHLHILQRVGMIAQFKDRNRTRLFDHPGKFQGNWQLVSLLRQTPHRELLEWLQNHGEANQKQVLAWSTERSWKRTATQARLRRLAIAGLIEARRAGRIQYYKATAVSQAPHSSAVIAQPAFA